MDTQNQNINAVKAVELELVNAPASASTELSVPLDRASALFMPFNAPFDNMRSLLAQESAAVDSSSARALRLKLVKARTSITSVKKDTKADLLIAGRVLDWYSNKGETKCAEAEARLEEIEKAAEREAARVKLELSTKRTAELSAFGVDGKFYALGDMPDNAYTQLLDSSKLAHETKIAAELKAKEDARIAAEKAEQERVAREQAEAAERERIKQENERLKAEADERERLAKIEREEAAAKLAAAEESARVEREAIAKEILKQKLEAEEAARVERHRVSEEKAKAEKLAAAKLAEAEAKAKAEREAAAEVARVEREKREALEKAEADRVKKETDRVAAEAKAARLFALAPERDKFNAFAVSVRGLVVPETTTDEGRAISEEIKSQVAKFAAWVEKKADGLAKEVA